METQLPSSKSGRSPRFSAHICCGQMAGWIKIHLVGRYRPQPKPHCVIRGPCSLSSKGGGAPPPFSVHVYCGQTAGWIKMALGTLVGLVARPHCVRRGPSSSRQRGTAAPSLPLFGSCLLWPRSPISATAELLFKMVAVRALAWIFRTSLFNCE